MKERTYSGMSLIAAVTVLLISMLIIASCEETPIAPQSYESPIPPALVADSSGFDKTFHAVWAGSADDAWAGGMDGEMRHFESGVWIKYPSGVTGTIYDIWGWASDDLYAVCFDGELLHWNGIEWSEIELNNTTSLLSVWGDEEVIYVGGRDGKTWRNTDGNWVPLSGQAPLDCWAIWGVDARVRPEVTTTIKTIFATGYKGWAARYGEGVWQFTPTSSVLGIWGTSYQDIYMVGSFDYILHFNGTKWSNLHQPSRQHLRGIHGNRRTNVFAVGVYGTLLHYAGGTWRQLETETTQVLRDVWVAPDNSVFAVGDAGVIIRGIPAN